MKVLMITNALSEGGVESLLLDLCRSLIVAHHNVAVLVLNRDAINLKSQFEEYGIKVFVGKYKNIYNPLNIFLIKKYIQWGQIVHVHLFPGQLFAVFAKLICKKNFPYITTEHNTFNNRRKYSFLKILDCYLYSKYDKIICISKQTEINLRKWLNKKRIDNILTINNGIDIDKFYMASDELKKYVKEQSEKNVQYIVMVGRFEFPKDQLTVIKALVYLPDNIHLIFVGSGITLQEYKCYAQNNGLLPRIHFLGNCKNVSSILKGCKLGILSTNWDGFGLVAVEYMAAGIPVIASDVDGLRDVVGRKDLLFKVGDAKELSDKILWLLEDFDMYQELKTYCIMNSRKYALNKMVNEYIDVYQETLRRNNDIFCL